MASAQGGMDIEEVAAKDPERDPEGVGRARRRLPGLPGPQARLRPGHPGRRRAKAVAFMQALYRAFEATDASLLEINPFLLTRDGQPPGPRRQDQLRRQRALPPPRAQGAARLRRGGPARGGGLEVQPQLHQARGRQRGLHGERRRPGHGHHGHHQAGGRRPANFLDVGGGANAEQIRNAFRILLGDQEVKAVLINIFGGILRCDVLAEGVIAAVRDLGVKVPVVVRMKGNNEEKGKEMLRASGLNFVTADDMTRGRAQGGGRGGGAERAMSVLVGKDTRLLVQGMGKHGTFHAIGCRDYGTNVVGGVTPGKGGTTRRGLPALRQRRARPCARRAPTLASIFVPPPGAADAIMEAADAGMPLVVCITEGIPTLDMVKVAAYLKGRHTRLIGPNCPGVISPGGEVQGRHHARPHPQGRLAWAS